MKKKRKHDIKRQGLAPGFEEGRYEPRRLYDKAEFTGAVEDPMKRDSRISVRIAGSDLEELKRQALAEGIPVQTLLADIIHQYATGQLREAPPDQGKGTKRAGRTSTLSHTLPVR